MFENTPSDRMQLVGLGELLSPATCMTCGSGVREEGYVKLGVWYDFEGEQYLCKICVTQAAELVGCLTSEEASHLQDQATLLATENAAYLEELEVARERLAVFDTAIRDIVTANPDVILGALTPSEEASEGLTPGVDSETPSGSDAGEPEPAESVKGSNSNGTGIITEPDEQRKPRIQL